MTGNELDLGQDALRQRRNLILVSVLLIFIAHADVAIDKQVTFLGVSLTIGSPEVIKTFLLIFEAYFLWRFYQYFVTDKAFFHLQSQYRQLRDRTLTLAIVKAVCKPRNISGLTGEYKYEDLKRKSLFYYSVHAAHEFPSRDPSGTFVRESFEAVIPVLRVELARVSLLVSFLFRGRILTDYYVPYLLSLYAGYLHLM